MVIDGLFLVILPPSNNAHDLVGMPSVTPGFQDHQAREGKAGDSVGQLYPGLEVASVVSPYI